MQIPEVQKCDALRYPDVHVENHGTLFLFHVLTDAGASWVGANISDPTFWGQAVVVEHRYAEDLANGMIESGLRVI